MIQSTFGIFVVLTGKVLLPAIVSRLAIGDMTFQRQPVLRMGNGPVVRQGKSHLRHRTGIDTKGLRTGTQFLVLQLHRLFLGTHGQRTFQPSHLSKSLMHNQFTCESCGHGDVEPIADAPLTTSIKRQRPSYGTTQITIRILQRAQPIPVGIEPQGIMVATREGCLHFSAIGKAIKQRALLRLSRQLRD